MVLVMLRYLLFSCWTSRKQALEPLLDVKDALCSQNPSLAVLCVEKLHCDRVAVVRLQSSPKPLWGINSRFLEDLHELGIHSLYLHSNRGGCLLLEVQKTLPCSEGSFLVSLFRYFFVPCLPVSSFELLGPLPDPTEVPTFYALWLFS